MQQDIRFCRTVDGTRIAYATLGSGPPLVLTSPWVTHLELDWEAPEYRTFLTSLARTHTVIRYDRHGCGLSDRTRSDPGLDVDLRTLDAVVDQLNLDRFALLGRSAGGPIAIAYAAAHPSRVSHLLLYGTHANVPPMALVESVTALIRANWGVAARTITTMLAPDADAEFSRWFARLQRESATADMAALLWSQPADVRSLLPTLTVPTVVMHRRDDQFHPFAWGRELAAAIPGARFVPLTGRAHMEWQGDAGQVLQAVAEALGVATPPPAAQVLSTSVPPPAATDLLTAREREVLRHVAAGLTNKEIASALGVATPTVERHLVNIYAKIGARGRADAIAYALRYTTALTS